ncbi:MAG: HesA/MoeB/ThiF family protein [Chthoniobacterales bacterium]
MPKQTNGAGKSCLFRITEADRRKLEALLFKRYPEHEWGSFFLFGYRITRWGIHVTFVESLDPAPGDLDEHSGIVEFAARYILRAQLRLEKTELAVGVIHSHPQNSGTGASMLDNDMDEYFSREFRDCSSGRPYVSLRVACTSTGRFTFSGEAWVGENAMRVTDFLTVGRELRHNTAERIRSWTLEPEDRNESRNRLVELLGEGAGRLRKATIGIVGCSGLGSPAVHVLVRAGVRRFVLVDPDLFAPSNLERMHGSNWRDVESTPPKVEILRRLILDIEPRAEVETIRDNVLDEMVLDALLKCDLVLGCTDTQHSRAALGDYANHYLLPCLDAAVLTRAKDGKLVEQVGEISRYSPNEPCPWCLGRIHQKVLAYELMTEEEREQRAHAAANAVRRGIDGEQYWGDTPPKELTVGHITTTLGAMQAGYAEMWITGAASMPHQRFQFDLGMPFLGVVPDEKRRKPECSCNRTKGWADQARCERSVTKPDHWNRPESAATSDAELLTISKPKVSSARKVIQFLSVKSLAIYKGLSASVRADG